MADGSARRRRSTAAAGCGAAVERRHPPATAGSSIRLAPADCARAAQLVGTGAGVSSDDNASAAGPRMAGAVAGDGGTAGRRGNATRLCPRSPGRRRLGAHEHRLQIWDSALGLVGDWRCRGDALYLQPDAAARDCDRHLAGIADYAGAAGFGLSSGGYSQPAEHSFRPDRAADAGWTGVYVQRTLHH